MSKVFGLQIEDPRLVRIARRLLYAQGCVFALSMAYGVVQIALQFVLRHAVIEAESSSGEESERSFMGSSSLSIMQTLVSLGIPFTLFIFARAALQGNNSDWLMLVTIADACGACCSCLAMISSSASVIFYQFLAKWSGDYDCSSAPVNGGAVPYAQDGGYNQTQHRAPTPAEVATCKQGMADASGLFHLLGRLALVATIFGVLDVLLCGFAASKASEANTALKQDLVFVVPPQPAPLQELCTQPAGMGGTVMVVGHPVTMSLDARMHAGHAVPQAALTLPAAVVRPQAE
uniref:Uncharacterized protein n=1 Tax=Alexandrium monilatum TaxID=311494 RepID=A0A7S4VTT7_9DINO